MNYKSVDWARQTPFGGETTTKSELIPPQTRKKKKKTVREKREAVALETLIT